jgi:hypothetical protein
VDQFKLAVLSGALGLESPTHDRMSIATQRGDRRSSLTFHEPAPLVQSHRLTEANVQCPDLNFDRVVVAAATGSDGHAHGFGGWHSCNTWGLFRESIRS